MDSEQGQYILHRIVLNPEIWAEHVAMQANTGRRGFTKPEYYACGFNGSSIQMYPGKPIDLPPVAAKHIIENSKVWAPAYDVRAGRKLMVQDQDSDRVHMVEFVAELTPQPTISGQPVQMAAFTCPFTGKTFDDKDEYAEHLKLYMNSNADEDEEKPEPKAKKRPGPPPKRSVSNPDD